jgi:hypothetical protein
MPGKYWQLQSIIHNTLPVKSIFDYYDRIREGTLNTRRFKHQDILPLIEKRNKKVFQIEKIGASYENRAIYMLKAGKGKKKIMIWSQMHGNEPTGTGALFDLFNFFETPGKFANDIEKILNNCSFWFIPMLNPDGAERFQRRNAQDIDINRDALRLISPEGKLLNEMVDKVKPDFGFNLHDQDIWYAAGNTSNPATLSFLAPSFNREKDTDACRAKSMRLIASITKELSSNIPKQIAKYSDDFMPTAFGDQIQKKGVSTVLVESGGYINDPEKQYVRKLNFLALLHAFTFISSGASEPDGVETYQKIPFNVKNKLFDCMIRQATIAGALGDYLVDIGIRSQSSTLADTFIIDDIGDLSGSFAYIEKTVTDRIQPVKIGEDAGALIQRYFKTIQ